MIGREALISSISALNVITSINVRWTPIKYKTIFVINRGLL